MFEYLLRNCSDFDYVYIIQSLDFCYVSYEPVSLENSFSAFDHVVASGYVYFLKTFDTVEEYKDYMALKEKHDDVSKTMVNRRKYKKM